MEQVSINGRFARQRVTGVQRYAIEVIRRLPVQGSLVSPSRRLSGPLGHVWEQTVLAGRILRKGGLLWSPTNTGPLAISNQVVTIHDAATLDSPEWFNKQFSSFYRLLLPKLINRVRKVITVSEFSKSRLLEHCRVPASKIAVIHNAVDSRFSPATQQASLTLRKKYSIKSDFILALGSIDPRKNLGRLVSAWKTIEHQMTDVALIVAGGRGSLFAELSELDYSADRVKFLGYVPEDDLVPLYSSALAFIYPSLYEGFGLPPLEAMACGTPVITSNVASLPEVVGDSALLVDPFNVDSIAEGILKLVSSSDLRRQLQASGRDRVSRFSWNETAEQTWRVLQDAAGEV